MDDMNIFIADTDGTVPEEVIDENSYLLLGVEEDEEVDEDYPTDEEIAEIMSEIFKDEQ